MTEADFDYFADTFNLTTVATAIVSGFMFGFLAFVPLVRRIVGGPQAEARQAFLLTFAVVFIIFGTTVVVFYVEQIVTEFFTSVEPTGAYWRAIGRLCSFLVFLSAFSVGVATDVWRAYREDK